MDEVFLPLDKYIKENTNEEINQIVYANKSNIVFKPKLTTISPNYRE